MTDRASPFYAVLILATVCAWGPLFIGGCSDTRPPVPAIVPPAETPKPPAIITPPKAGETDTERSLREARNTVSRLAGDLATWQQRVTTLQEDKKREDREKVLAYLRVCLLWITGLALLGGVVCVVLAIVSPVAKSTLARLGIACAAVLVLCAGMLWCLPWLPVVGVVVLVTGLAVGLIVGGFYFARWFVRHMHAAVTLADGLQQVTAAAVQVMPGKVLDMDVENRAQQILTNAMGEGDKLLDAARTLRDKRERKKTPPPVEASHV